MRLKPLNQQIVVVMGASSGIGRATALNFAAHGATVVCSARDGRGLTTLVDEITARGGRAVALVADVADPAQMVAVAAFAAHELGRIDTWVHIAAVSVYARFEDTTPAEFARVIEVNLLGQIHGALAAIPHLRAAGRGALICVSSVEGQVSLPFQSAYAASKHGVVGALDALRIELDREGAAISVTNIMPSGINTPLFQKALTRLGVEPRPPPPVYAAELVSFAILHAACTPRRDLVVGGAGWALALALAHRLSPSLTDAILRSPTGYDSQLTHRLKSPEARSNLFQPSLSTQARVEGIFGAETLRNSLFTRIELSRGAVAVGRAASAVASVAARVFEAGFRLGLRKAAPRPGNSEVRR